MDVNVKDLNKFIGPDGVTVLDEVRVSPTEPAFRQNGYETNGDKKSFALGFDAGNSEYVEFDDFTLGQNESVIVNIENLAYQNGISYYLFANNDSDEFINTSFFGGANIFCSIKFLDGTLWNVTLPSLISEKLELKRLSGDDYELFVDNVSVGTNNVSSTLTFNTINSRLNNSTFNQDFNVNSFQLGSENYPLRRGLGVELIGSNGTTAEIKTSAANPQQRVNFGMWLKGDDINGWNPYTV